jgi:hypothetical protein
MPAGSVSEEISHLVRRGPDRGPEKGKPYSQKRAVAAALSMQRRGRYRRGGRRKSR